MVHHSSTECCRNKYNYFHIPFIYLLRIPALTLQMFLLCDTLSRICTLTKQTLILLVLQQRSVSETINRKKASFLVSQLLF